MSTLNDLTSHKPVHTWTTANGFPLSVRGWTVAELLKVQDWCKEPSIDLFAQIAALSLVEKDGSPVEGLDVATLINCSVSLLQEIATEAMTFNGGSPKSIADEKKS